MPPTTRDAARCIEPNPQACAHCGAMREPITVPAPVRIAGRAVGEPLLVGWERCGCEGAVAERAARDAAKAAEDAEASRRLWDARVAKAGIKPRYAEASHPLASELAAEVMRGRSLYITGGNGTGKTHLASAVALAILRERKRPLMLTGIDLTLALQATYGTSGSEAEAMERLCGYDVLIIDDLGKEPPTDWALSRLFAVVNRRYEQLAPMVVTTNYTRGQLIERLGRKGDGDTAQALVSRLREMSRAVALDGPDMRLSRCDGVPAQGCEDGGAR